MEIIFKILLIIAMAALGFMLYTAVWLIADSNPTFGESIRTVRLVVVGSVVALAFIAAPFIWKDTFRSLQPNADSPKPPFHYNPDLTHETADNLVGQEGVVQAALRPMGNIRIDDKSYVVRSEGQFIEEGKKIRIARIDEHNIVVVPFTESSGAEHEQY
ncbi:MAG: NfeD family protein [Candidatus Hydrogenedentes bacterium]|nr:NfeD family protein [Candidatus Hydrogenedentota bacterium]